MLLLFAVGFGIIVGLAISDNPAPQVDPRTAVEQLGGKVYLGEDGTVVAVDLGRTKTTDADLALVKQLPQLRGLSLWGTQVGDTGLLNLEDLSQLEELNLLCTKVSDAGLVHLKGARQLRSLNLLGTSVTRDGVADLRKSLPLLVVVR
ncbi:MAG: hypothetical protein ABSG68_06810 [Thermoguttaceae bacterium]